MEVQEVELQDHPIASGKAQGSYGVFLVSQKWKWKEMFPKDLVGVCVFFFLGGGGGASDMCYVGIFWEDTLRMKQKWRWMKIRWGYRIVSNPFHGWGWLRYGSTNSTMVQRFRHESSKLQEKETIWSIFSDLSFETFRLVHMQIPYKFDSSSIDMLQYRLRFVPLAIISIWNKYQIQTLLMIFKQSLVKVNQPMVIARSSPWPFHRPSFNTVSVTPQAIPLFTNFPL